MTSLSAFFDQSLPLIPGLKHPGGRIPPFGGILHSRSSQFGSDFGQNLLVATDFIRAVGWIFLRSRPISRELEKSERGKISWKSARTEIGPKSHFWPILGILRIPDKTMGNVKISILGDFFHFFSLFSQKKVKKMAKIP